MNGESDEQERMVVLAVKNGWIADAVRGGLELGIINPVVVLATFDCSMPPAPFGSLVRKAMAEEKTDRAAEKYFPAQDAAGCARFFWFTSPLEMLCDMIAEGGGDRALREAARGEGRYAVMCINHTTAAIVRSVF